MTLIMMQQSTGHVQVKNNQMLSMNGSIFLL